MKLFWCLGFAAVLAAALATPPAQAGSTPEQWQDSAAQPSATATSQKRDVGHPASVLLAQQSPPQKPPAPPESPPPASQPDLPGNPHGKVLFERSQPAPDDIPDEVPATAAGPPILKTREVPDVSKIGSAPLQTARPADTGPIATDAERAAPTFTAYDLDVRLVPAEASIAVRARMTIRNDGAQPLTRLPLQISSTLTWLSVHAANQKLPFTQRILNSDIDHTGEVSEALVNLPAPLAPAASITLDALYSGTIPSSAQRLERIGAPQTQAIASDWDRIAPDFTGLRGFGNVLWYPAASAPLALGDGARLFEGIGAWKQRQSPATISMRVQVEYRGDAPTTAVLDGQIVSTVAVDGVDRVRASKPPLNNKAAGSEVETASPKVETADPDDATDLSIPRTATFDLPPGKLGFQAPSLFVVSGNMEQQSDLRIYFRNQEAGNTQAYFAGAALVQPLFQEWFGLRDPNQPGLLNLVDLPEETDQPFDAGGSLFLAIRAAQPSQLTPMFSQSLTAAWFSSPRVWMSQGLAQFMSLLWTERTVGRAIAYEQLEAQRAALALAEPETPGEGIGQTLDGASDAVYYRTKAAYVWWMLRSIVGEKPLQTALRQYRADQDTGPNYFQRLLEPASGKDLRWFFDDWVYHDRGLPDLSIAAVIPRRLEATEDYLVAVEVANSGYAAAEVPVTLHSGPATVSQRLLVQGRSSATTRILIHGPPDSVTVNDGSVPESRATVHRKDIEIAAQPESTPAR